MRVTLLAAVMALWSVAPCAQATVVGSWEGTIDVAGVSLATVVRLATGENGLSGTIDIPQQGAKGLPLRAVAVSGPNVTFELPTGGASAMFTGTLEADRMTGTFVQGPATGTFTLTRKVEAPPAPVEPPPYRVDELTVRNGSVELAGTLSRPESASGPVPAVVMVSGSGAQNRDEEIFGFKVFAVVADYLTRHGVAVYRYDDRGVGKSIGPLATATSEDFAGDALAAVAQLRTVEGIDPARVGIFGHSEGGMVAAIAAARSPDVAFIVMMAGTAVAGDRVLHQQVHDGAIANGATPEQVARIDAAHVVVTESVLKGASAEDRLQAARALVEAQVSAAPAAQLAALGDREAYIDRATKIAALQMASPWMKFMLGFDPAQVIRTLKVPVFAAFGSKDTQVPPSLHEGPMRAALAANSRSAVKVYDGANHLFQQARTGQVLEYAVLDKAFVPGFLDDVANWILAAGR